MLKIKRILLLIIIMFVFPTIVKANSISKIDMDIYLDKSGNAHVTEVWSANLNKGTEGYKPYYNLGNAKITDFKVSEDGKTYMYDDYWNVDASFSEKAYKNGINYVSNGVELCWGISSYGYHNYVLNYTIEGFVATNADSDMIYWTLIPYELSSKPSDVHIKIHGDDYFNSNTPVWGYGNYGGSAYVYDGYIEMNSEGTLESNEYMTLLVKFDKGMFNTSNVIENNFEYYHNMAQEGAKKYKENEKIDSILAFIFMFFQFGFWALMILIFSRSIKKANNTIGSKVLEFGSDGKKLPKDIPNVREIPFNKDIFRTFWIAQAYKLGKKKTDFFGAILLKWLKDDKIMVKKVTHGSSKNKDALAIDLTKEVTFDQEVEQELFIMMKEASKDGILESKEFEKWCNNNYNKILSWFDKVLDGQTQKLIEEGKITITETTNFNIFKSKKYVVNKKMKEDAIKLKGLKNFLEEFSRIDDKEAIEVNMWEYYLIYAQILGIADKVAKQFKKLYPELLENNNYGYTLNDIIFINMLSYSSMNTATSSMQRARNYSSGGGGFSSGGGGGGSFGGGGGGGGFR